MVTGVPYSLGSTLVQDEGQTWNLTLRYMQINMIKRQGNPDRNHSLSPTPQDRADIQLTHDRSTSIRANSSRDWLQPLDDEATGSKTSDLSAFVSWSMRYPDAHRWLASFSGCRTYPPDAARLLFRIAVGTSCHNRLGLFSSATTPAPASTSSPKDQDSGIPARSITIPNAASSAASNTSKINAHFTPKPARKTRW